MPPIVTCLKLGDLVCGVFLCQIHFLLLPASLAHPRRTGAWSQPPPLGGPTPPCEGLVTRSPSHSPRQAWCPPDCPLPLPCGSGAHAGPPSPHFPDTRPFVSVLQSSRSANPAPTLNHRIPPRPPPPGPPQPLHPKHDYNNPRVFCAVHGDCRSSTRGHGLLGMPFFSGGV